MTSEPSAIPAPDTAREESTRLDALWQHARGASERSDFAALAELTSQAASLAARLHGENHPETARALNELAYALRRQGNYAAAEPVLRRLIAIQEALVGPQHPSLGLLLDLLAAAVSRVHPGRMSEVKKLENRAAQLRLKRR